MLLMLLNFFLAPQKFLPWRKFTGNKEEINREQGENLSQTRKKFLRNKEHFLR
ncbi:hypothetical protein HMPREF0973_01574 [Prevotella veroralis F0319]|uniref:Uncharacterized protein n=1 Tax=Prevotella veroralis F0319 TaxID=649761 RepID=C9MPN3_9BACT|nr:hypothetical protein HMPREF0973_01574 [Prevotella veroralis F0319]